MDKLKTYFVEVVLKNVAPKVTNAVIAAGITFLLAHQEFMSQMGITYYGDFHGIWNGPAPTGRLLVLEIDTFGLWGGAALIALATAAWAFLSHHGVATVTGAPQSGDMRLTPSPSIVNGERKEDKPNALDKGQAPK